jgi:1,4-dihydroxy-2-naphthoyl-CoA hydrolase
MIWFKDYTLDYVREETSSENILNYLGMEFLELGQDYLTARLPVDERTHQIHGILHGGATCTLAETLGSVCSLLVVDPEKNYAVGSVITTNHLRPALDGFVTGICKPVHLGRTKHVWDIMITNDDGKLIAKSELTCAVTPRR